MTHEHPVGLSATARLDGDPASERAEGADAHLGGNAGAARRPAALRALPWLSLALCVVGLAAALAHSDACESLLVSAQAAGAAWLAANAWWHYRTWVSASFILACAWVLLFVAPSFIYLTSSGIRPTGLPFIETLAILNVSLFTLIGVALLDGGRRKGPVASEQAPRGLDVRWTVVRPVRVWAVAAAAVLAMGVIFAANGGPLRYLDNLDQTGSMNRGLTYLVWIASAGKFAVLVALCAMWSRGRGAPAGMWWAAVVAIGGLGLLGSRGLVAIGLVQLAVLYVLCRGPIPLRRIAPVAVAVGIVIVFVFGAVKRYQGATHSGSQLSLTSYLVHVAPGEARLAYANNYADGVALIGKAREVVPRDAPYELGLGLVRLGVKPIPSPWRPTVKVDPAVRAAFIPGGGYALAVPLSAFGYLQFGLAGVVLCFALLGSAVATGDRLLWQPRPQSVPSVVVFAAFITQIPVLVRGGLPDGLVFLLLDMAGFWLVARFCIDRSLDAPGPGTSRETP